MTRQRTEIFLNALDPALARKIGSENVLAIYKLKA
jgi:hypothetical protein